MCTCTPGRVLDGAALLMRAVAEGGAAAAGPLREAALSEGAMLHHLLVACTAQVTKDFQNITFKYHCLGNMSFLC